MQINLSGKAILLGITGSISAYKACEVARLFVKAGADVHVVMTQSAQRFISSLTLEALTRNSVLTEESESWSNQLNHIDIGKKCDAFVIAPATANTINKLYNGVADNILTQVALAFNGPTLIAPAANTQMLHNPITENSLNSLIKDHFIIINSQSKLLACGDTGDGGLAEPQDIFYETSKSILKEDFWLHRDVIITGGGTLEKIDEVRYISNFSSGKMAKSIALNLYLKGANVCYITTNQDNEELPISMNIVSTQSSSELFQTLKNEITSTNDSTKIPYLFMVAAVSDFTPKDPQQGKVKKSTIGDNWSIELEQTQDILSSIDKSNLKTVAFKAEMDKDNGLYNAKQLLVHKDVDAVCYNHLNSSKDFGTNSNDIIFITKSDEIHLGKLDKFLLADKLVNSSKEL